jgi:urea transport system substrate-binding protein
MKLAWILRRLLPALLVLDVSAAHAAEDTIKVGILHSLSGTMAISESALKDTVLMLVADQNKKGGLLGRKLESVIVDPASDWDAFTDKAFELLAKEKVAVVFGCWTSTSRKAVIPVFERLNGLLFYPVQHEGEESSRNVFYTGASPSQQAIPAVRYLTSKEGGEIRRWVLLGTDSVYPRTTNRILGAYLAAEGVNPDDITTIYTPLGQSDWREIIQRIKAFGSQGKKTAVISTVSGDANGYLYNELAAQQVDAGNSGHGPLPQRARIARRGCQPARRAHGGAELFPVGDVAGERRIRQNVDRLQPAARQDDKRSDGGDPHRLSDVGAGRHSGRHG